MENETENSFEAGPVIDLTCENSPDITWTQVKIDTDDISHEEIDVIDIAEIVQDHDGGMGGGVDASKNILEYSIAVKTSENNDTNKANIVEVICDNRKTDATDTKQIHATHNHKFEFDVAASASIKMETPQESVVTWRTDSHNPDICVPHKVEQMSALFATKLSDDSWQVNTTEKDHFSQKDRKDRTLIIENVRSDDISTWNITPQSDSDNSFRDTKEGTDNDSTESICTVRVKTENTQNDMFKNEKECTACVVKLDDGGSAKLNVSSVNMCDCDLFRDEKPTTSTSVSKDTTSWIVKADHIVDSVSIKHENSFSDSLEMPQFFIHNINDADNVSSRDKRARVSATDKLNDSQVKPQKLEPVADELNESQPVDISRPQELEPATDKLNESRPVEIFKPQELEPTAGYDARCRQSSCLTIQPEKQQVKLRRKFTKLLTMCETKKCYKIQCTGCQVVFTDAIDFTKHFAGSACVYPIVCHICLLYCASAKNFVDHLTTAHEDGFACDCGQIFETKDYCRLYVHAQTCRYGHPYLRKNHLTMTLYPETKVAVFLPLKVPWDDIEKAYQWEGVQTTNNIDVLAVTIQKKTDLKVSVDTVPPDDYDCVVVDKLVSSSELELYIPEQEILEKQPWFPSMQDFVHSRLEAITCRLITGEEVLRKIHGYSNYSSFRNYLCASCGASFSNVQHVVEKRCSHPLVCHICNIAFTKVALFHAHMSGHRPFSCDCSASFDSYMALFIHSVECFHANPIVKQNSYAEFVPRRKMWVLKEEMFASSRKSDFIVEIFQGFQHQHFTDNSTVIILVLTAEAFDWKKRNRPPISESPLIESIETPAKAIGKFVFDQMLTSVTLCVGEREVLSILNANQDCLDFACASCCHTFFSSEAFLEHLELGYCMHLFFCHLCRQEKNLFASKEMFNAHMETHLSIATARRFWCKCGFGAFSYSELYSHSLKCSIAYTNVRECMYDTGATSVPASMKWSNMKLCKLIVTAKKITIFSRRTLVLLIMTPFSFKWRRENCSKYEKHQMMLTKLQEIVDLTKLRRRTSCSQVSPAEIWSSYEEPKPVKSAKQPMKRKNTATKHRSQISCNEASPAEIWSNYEEPKPAKSAKQPMKRKSTATKKSPVKKRREKNHHLKCLKGFQPDKNSEIVCTACKRHFDRISGVKDHFENFSCRRLLTCHICKVTFTTLRIFLRHMPRHSDNLFCACNARFPTYKHMYVHSTTCLKADRAAVMQDIKQTKTGALQWTQPSISLEDIKDGSYHLSVDKYKLQGKEVWKLNVMIVR